VQLRYVGSLLPPNGLVVNSRLDFQGRKFNLIWVNNVEERHKTYELLAQELLLKPPVTTTTTTSAGPASGGPV
jgi:hypothetical protein